MHRRGRPFNAWYSSISDQSKLCILRTKKTVCAYSSYNGVLFLIHSILNKVPLILASVYCIELSALLMSLTQVMINNSTNYLSFYNRYDPRAIQVTMQGTTFWNLLHFHRFTYLPLLIVIISIHILCGDIFQDWLTQQMKYNS